MSETTEQALLRIADALERITPPPRHPTDMMQFDGYVWDAKHRSLTPVEQINRIPLDALVGIESQKQALLENTAHFASGLRANNALLWGARGTGKSSLVKAVHGHVTISDKALALVEIQREDLADLTDVMVILAQIKRRFILYCDDLAFEQNDNSYKALKAVLEGGLTGRPENIVFYATSNRRHLMPRQMIENERGSAINPSEATEEKISLSDRFGLWIGFHSVDQEQYLEMISRYVDLYNIPCDWDEVRADALKWAMGRGNRSGRTAYQFIIHLAMTHNISL